MRRYLLLTVILMINCSQEEKVYAPVGLHKETTELQELRDRAKNLNLVERRLMEEWMKNEKDKFFPTRLNYWINKENFEGRTVNSGDLKISYKYTMSDFDGTKVYDLPQGFKDIPLNKITDIKAVQNALQKMKIGEEVKLLVPSALAYGANGDGNKIGNDVPLIINLKIIDSDDKK